MAIRAHHRGVIASLIESGADVNWMDDRLVATGGPLTLLMIALEHGDEETAKALIKKGARKKDEVSDYTCNLETIMVLITLSFVVSCQINSRLILAVKQRRLADVLALLKQGNSKDVFPRSKSMSVSNGVLQVPRYPS